MGPDAARGAWRSPARCGRAIRRPPRENPNAWLKRRYAPDEITTPTADNRLIAWPYNKLMVANPSVNMGGALLLTSLAKARAAGIAEDKLVYPLGGASAEEPRDYLLRDQFYESHPQNAVLKAVMDLAGGDGKKFDAIELYSCFPACPRWRGGRWASGADVQPTVTGGLTFFGAPLNTYMTHAACAMVRRVRDGAKLGLLYGQGGFVTKHHALVVSKTPPRRRWRRRRACKARPTATSARCRSSSRRPQRQGQGRELYGALWPRRRGRARRGDAAHGGRAAHAGAHPGERHARRWRICSNMDRTPVGSLGEIAMAADGVPEWRVA